MTEERERARAESALKIVGKLQTLVVNVGWWVANGKSETATQAITRARNDGWTEMGWRPHHQKFEGYKPAMDPDPLYPWWKK